MNANNGSPGVPLVGILCWEAGHKDTLSPFEQIAGNIANPNTFDFPVIYRRVKGAYYQTVVVQPSRQVLAAMIQAARELEQEGIGAIATSCGFNAIFQRELANAVSVPVFASSRKFLQQQIHVSGANHGNGLPRHANLYSLKTSRK